MKDTEILFESSPPFIIVDEYTEFDAKWLPSVRYEKSGLQTVVRVLRANKMATWQGMMDEFGAALQFFEGFGENAAALEDCLTLLNEWLPGEAYILEVLAGHHLLIQEQAADLALLLRVLSRAGKAWAKPIDGNPPYDRPALPFHTVIKIPPAEMAGFLTRVADCGEEKLVATAAA